MTLALSAVKISNFRPHRSNSKMGLIATDGVAWSVCVRVCACLLVTFMSPATSAEPIKMPFEWVVGPRNHELDGVELIPAKFPRYGSKVSNSISDHPRILSNANQSAC